MEQIADTVANVGQIKTLQGNQSSSTKTTPQINREQHAALFAIINKSRMLNGWQTRTAQELDPTIRVWSEIFAQYGIPVLAYNQLYKRAFDVRQSKLQIGKEPPTMDATLLVSQWTGENGLKAELRRQEIERGRTLANNAESQCKDCFGSGYKTIKRGDYNGTAKCDHGNG